MSESTANERSEKELNDLTVDDKEDGYISLLNYF